MLSHAPVPYEGTGGIRQLLDGMEGLLGWEPIADRGRPIGLLDPTHGGAISLEPGGQFEPAARPFNLHQTATELQAHMMQVLEIATPLKIGFLALGASPIWTLPETPVMPKSRYAIMSDYMPTVGTRGLDMMFRTATVQVNLDFASEADMRRKMQVSIALQPVATALFANSPYLDGRATGRLSERSEIWRDTDNARAGMIPSCSRRGSVSSAMSNGRSTCRCISSSAATPTTGLPTSRSVSSWPEPSATGCPAWSRP